MSAVGQQCPTAHRTDGGWSLLAVGRQCPTAHRTDGGWSLVSAVGQQCPTGPRDRALKVFIIISMNCVVNLEIEHLKYS